MIKKFLSPILLCCILFSCQKVEEITHREGVVEENEIPNYNAVSDVLLNNYINKYFIDLIGIQPVDSVLEDARKRLKTGPKEDAKRVELISEAISDTSYFNRFFSTTSLIFIEGFERPYLQDRQAEYDLLIENARANGDTLLVQLFEFEQVKMDSLIQAPTRLMNEDITLRQYYRAFCYNYVYDEINMGTTNFVISCFENLLGRQPTVDEQQRAETMVDGISAHLFLSEGNSKHDFINIMLQTPEFLIGRTKDVYKQLVQRIPNTSEEVQGVEMLRNKNNLKELQIQVAKSSEYAGF